MSQVIKIEYYFNNYEFFGINNRIKYYILEFLI